MEEQLDVIAVGVHPDDVEIACGGTLAKLARQGYRVGIIDLTDGEPTPGSPSPAVRLAEARQAAQILGVETRVTLELPNRRLFDSFEARLALARHLRSYRPRLVIALGGRTPLASPDHYQAGLITEAAVFYSRLTKWEEHFGDLPPHAISALLYCSLAFRGGVGAPPGMIIVDISDTLETKLAAIAAYVSQFPPEKAQFLERIRAFAVQQGLAAGFAAGEVLTSSVPLGTGDLMGLLFGSGKK
jgi:LmbE family N-acetylglucosaminyl deacetylase